LSVPDLSQPNPRRSLILLAIGALAGLGIAGYGLFTAQGTAMRGVPPEAIATVNRRLILRTDFVTQVQTQFGMRFSDTTRAQRRQVLDDMIGEELMVQRGLEADLASYDPEVRQALLNGVELQIFADVLAQQPTDAQLKAYYAEHRNHYVRDGTMQLRDLTVVTRAREPSGSALQTAQRAVELLRQGVALEAVMKQYALQDSRKLLDSGHVDTGLVFDFAARAHLDPKVYAAAAPLSGGAVSDPIATQDAIHIVVMLMREPPRQRDFSEVSNEVWRDLKKDAQQQVRAANLRYLKSKADIEIADAG
jgi:parvulin-like peptidyl-prolyl isomerase